MHAQSRCKKMRWKSPRLPDCYSTDKFGANVSLHDVINWISMWVNEYEDDIKVINSLHSRELPGIPDILVSQTVCRNQKGMWNMIFNLYDYFSWHLFQSFRPLFRNSDSVWTFGSRNSWFNVWTQIVWAKNHSCIDYLPYSFQYSNYSNMYSRLPSSEHLPSSE